MSVKWNRTAGADNYSIYIKYPGSSSFKKVKTTTAAATTTATTATTTTSNFFTLTGMKKNTKYGIKVIANKKMKNKELLD